MDKAIAKTRFQSTLPVWGATHEITCINPNIKPFQSTLPVWGATFRQAAQCLPWWDFNPRSPCGERPMVVPGIPMIIYFNPRSPCGERQEGAAIGAAGTDFNPRSPCGERLRLSDFPDLRLVISIHAPRVGSDRDNEKVAQAWAISIHAPRVGSDGIMLTLQKFTAYFNPRSPCGERLFVPVLKPWIMLFQSTLPVWGATDHADLAKIYGIFQSTLPVWGATARCNYPWL